MRVKFRNSLLTPLMQFSPSVFIVGCNWDMPSYFISCERNSSVPEKHSVRMACEKLCCIGPTPTVPFLFLPILWQQSLAFLLWAGRGEGGSRKRSGCPLGEALSNQFAVASRDGRELTGNTLGNLFPPLTFAAIWPAPHKPPVTFSLEGRWEETPS